MDYLHFAWRSRDVEITGRSKYAQFQIILLLQFVLQDVIQCCQSINKVFWNFLNILCPPHSP